MKMVKGMPGFASLLVEGVIISYSWNWRNLAGDRECLWGSLKGIATEQPAKMKSSALPDRTAHSGKGTWFM